LNGPALIGRVEEALKELITADRPVTFTDVATGAGVARPTLYRNPTLRALVEEHRLRQAEARTLSGLSTQITHLRTALENVSSRVRQQEERLRRLEGRSSTKSA